MRLPDHITEAEVLALIEGELALLPHDRRETVRAAVAADPALATLVAEMRSDASAIVSMPRLSAPPMVRRRVLEDLQKPMPRPEFIREPAGGEIPVSSVIVSRESPWRRRLERIPFRQLATAAGLLLAAGAAIWVVNYASKFGSFTPRSINGPVARNTDPVPAPPAIPVPDFGPISMDPGFAVASDTPEPDELTSAPLLVDEYGFATAWRSAPRIVDDIELPVPARMPMAEAIELARAGRLIIRIRAVDETEAREDIAAFAQSTARDFQWRPLEAWELPQVASALRRPDVPYAADRSPTPPAQATDQSRPAQPPIEPVGVAADVASVLRNASFRPLYTVEMDENERDLAAMLDRLSKDRAHVAEFVALEEPLPTLMPSTDPGAVLWWTKAPSGWTRRVCVPIVLETER